MKAAEGFNLPKKRKQGKQEQNLQTFVSDFIRLKYPDTEFLCDVAAGMKMNKWMAALVKRWRSDKSLPDVYIFEARGQWNALLLELKAESAPLHKKDGSIRKNEHLGNQQSKHTKLCNKGYLSMFVKGRDHAMAVINWYMSGAIGDPPSYKSPSINLFS